MNEEMSTAERFQRALKWEKAVVILSFWLCVILFLGPGILLGKFVAPAVIGSRPPALSELAHLAVGGFAAMVCVGTIIIAADFLCRVTAHALRSRIGQG